MTVLQTLVTLKQPQVTLTHFWHKTNALIHLMSPYYTKRRPNHNRMYTVDHTSGYCSQKFIRACTKLSAHAHSTEIRVEILNSLKLPWDSQGNECGGWHLGAIRLILVPFFLYLVATKNLHIYFYWSRMTSVGPF